MITFKNRFAEFDNLDDSQNDNVLKNCYYKEFHRNFLRFHGPNSLKGNHNHRYSGQNYNDIRLKNLRNNNTLINSHRQNSFTPFPQIPINNSSNINNFRSIPSNNNFNQRQNANLFNSSPNYNTLRNGNSISTPISAINNFNNNSFNNINNSFENSFSFSNNNDNIQYFNESDNRYNGNNSFNFDLGNNNMDNSLNMSNDYQYNQELEYQMKNNVLENEIQKEKQKQILLEQERLNQIETELKELRLKRNNDLRRKLEQKRNEEKMMNETRLRNIHKKKINSYRIHNRNKHNKSLRRSILEESFRSNLINDRLYMNQLIDEINRMKVSQNEANNQFRRKMDDLFIQNEQIQNYNKDLMRKIKEVKYAVKDQEDNTDTVNDYIIEQRNKMNNRYQNYFRNGNTIRNKLPYRKIVDDDKFNNYDDNKKFDYNYKNYFLGKKDKDEEEFNLLNQNLVNGNNGVVVSPLIYDKNNKNNKKIKLKSFSRNENNKDDLYSLIRKNNDRLDSIKELEEKMNYKH